MHQSGQSNQHNRHSDLQVSVTRWNKTVYEIENTSTGYITRPEETLYFTGNKSVHICASSNSLIITKYMNTPECASRGIVFACTKRNIWTCQYRHCFFVWLHKNIYESVLQALYLLAQKGIYECASTGIVFVWIRMIAWKCQHIAFTVLWRMGLLVIKRWLYTCVQYRHCICLHKKDRMNVPVYIHGSSTDIKTSSVYCSFQILRMYISASTGIAVLCTKNWIYEYASTGIIFACTKKWIEE